MNVSSSCLRSDYRKQGSHLEVCCGPSELLKIGVRSSELDFFVPLRPSSSSQLRPNACETYLSLILLVQPNKTHSSTNQSLPLNHENQDSMSRSNKATASNIIGRQTLVVSGKFTYEYHEWLTASKFPLPGKEQDKEVQLVSETTMAVPLTSEEGNDVMRRFQVLRATYKDWQETETSENRKKLKRNFVKEWKELVEEEMDKLHDLWPNQIWLFKQLGILKEKQVPTDQFEELIEEVRRKESNKINILRRVKGLVKFVETSSSLAATARDSVREATGPSYFGGGREVEGTSPASVTVDMVELSISSDDELALTKKFLPYTGIKERLEMLKGRLVPESDLERFNRDLRLVLDDAISPGHFSKEWMRIDLELVLTPRSAFKRRPTADTHPHGSHRLDHALFLLNCLASRYSEEQDHPAETVCDFSPDDDGGMTIDAISRRSSDASLGNTFDNMEINPAPSPSELQHSVYIPHSRTPQLKTLAEEDVTPEGFFAFKYKTITGPEIFEASSNDHKSFKRACSAIHYITYNERDYEFNFDYYKNLRDLLPEARKGELPQLFLKVFPEYFAARRQQFGFDSAEAYKKNPDSLPDHNDIMNKTKLHRNFLVNYQGRYSNKDISFSKIYDELVVKDGRLNSFIDACIELSDLQGLLQGGGLDNICDNAHLMFHENNLKEILSNPY
ncbi:hypothetical protein T439DRAFT_331444 [Meredithblackwellia eburnea MCA 4105]